VLTEEEFNAQRKQMVEQQLQTRDINNPRVLAAMGRIPRHKFVAIEYRHSAYHDGPLPIGEEQTISQPYIVALMTQLLALEGHERVLEIGTGCGYQTAVLCELAQYVYSLERFHRLAHKAGTTLSTLGYTNVDLHVGDGSQGLPDMEPFQAIIVTAAAPIIPGPLCAQLHPDNGRLVIPAGSRQDQTLQVVYREGQKFRVEESIPVRFVPLVGKYGFTEDEEDAPPPAAK
jgi:protein-L-isoaspartate(D-aspartate) O-methyltransferase